MKTRSITPREQRSTEQLNAVQNQIATLHALKMPELWKIWDLHFSRRPEHTNRKFVISRLTYRLQELAFGVLPQATRERLADCGQHLSKIQSKTPAKAVAMPGATLVREFDLDTMCTKPGWFRRLPCCCCTTHSTLCCEGCS